MKTKAARLPFSSGRLLPCLLLAAGSVALLGACGYRPLKPYNTQNDLPEAVRVPAGYQVAIEATSNGQLMYECQAVKRAPYEYEWLLRSPGVTLTDTYGNRITHKPGVRATWAHQDGSSVMSREFIEVPNGEPNLTLQRYKAEPSETPGMLHNISYVQRLRTVGGWVAAIPCSAPQLGMRRTVPYEADYIFWRAKSS
ncbi:DUF3455 domain-containing protein [Polaromonas sp. A23]|uniref:DUF3455 domain-containing protein n=1 Tax=Polaromonas sp. A23 TaxID=1944133 RepID=UPI00143B51CD|nr:DUF3455 domain-containing protein [Polaromonas sp. A23]